MRIFLPILAAVILSAQSAFASEFGAIDLAAKKVAEVPQPEMVREGSGISTYRSFRTFTTKAKAVSEMYNTEARLLEKNIPVFEKKTVKGPGNGYHFEISYIAPARISEYSSKRSFPLAALAMNAALNSESTMLQADIPVTELDVIYDADGSCRYKLYFLSDSEVKTFVPENTFGSAAGAANEMYNTMSRLMDGKLGVIEARVTAAGGRHSFEIFYVPAGK